MYPIINNGIKCSEANKVSKRGIFLKRKPGTLYTYIDSAHIQSKSMTEVLRKGIISIRLDRASNDLLNIF